VPGIAALGPDPMGDAFTAVDLRDILQRAGRAQLKGVLRDQKVLAGIGNAYSDEILHAARLSPFKPAGSLDEAAVEELFGHIRGVLGAAIGAAADVPIDKLKDAKRSNMRVHGRTGEACDACGATIAEVSFADSSLQYCPGCQTDGKLLADRRMSRLLK
jgi:formamidopyrimidine-DNA glycosylase